SGLSASILPNSLSLDIFHNPVSAVLTVSGTGSGAVSINAVPNTSSGLASRSTMVNVVNVCVQAFTVGVTPSTLYIDGDDVRTATSTITVTSVGSFAGTVCLSQTGGNVLSPIISPSCVTVTAGGQVTATITV